MGNVTTCYIEKDHDTDDEKDVDKSMHPFEVKNKIVMNKMPKLTFV